MAARSDTKLAMFLARVQDVWVPVHPNDRCFKVLVDGQEIGRIKKGKSRPGQLLPWKVYLRGQYVTEIYGCKNEGVAEVLAAYLTGGGK